MSTPRQTIAAQVKADHPDWKVFSYPHKPSNVETGHPVVCVFRTEVLPASKPQWITHAVTVQAFGAKTMLEAAEDEMDNLLDGVLLSLERVKGYTMQSAKRATFYEGSLSGWEIEATATSANVYRDTVLKEGK